MDTRQQAEIKNLLTNAVPLLCKKGLSFSTEMSVEALIGITLDKNNVILVNIKETLLPNDRIDENSASDCESVTNENSGNDRRSLKRSFCETRRSDAEAETGMILDRK